MMGRVAHVLSATVLLIAVARGKELTVTATFSNGMSEWLPLDPDNWTVRNEAGNAALVLVKPGKQKPPVRRPSEYVLLKGGVWEDVTVETRVKTLRPDRVKGRDICLLFGYRDDTHFYYAHLCSDSNGRTHNVIMKVSGTNRSAIMKEKCPPARLTGDWHRVRVVHHHTGEIAVYMDDMEKPFMTAFDRDYLSGAVGLGSFDDIAMFDDVSVRGIRVSPPQQ